MYKSVSQMRVRRLLVVGWALLAGCSKTLGIERLTVALTPDSGSGGDGMPGGSGGAPNGGSDGMGMAMAGTGAGGQGGSTDAGATECGGAGQPCCEGVPSCQAGLGCSEGKCILCAAFESVAGPMGDTASNSQAISSDGKVVVGTSSGTGQERAYRLVRGDPNGAVDLGALPGGMTSHASAVSADGYAVVGEADSPEGKRAFRWTPDQGLRSLGVLYPGDTTSTARGVSADGNVVVGQSTGADGTTRAFRWRANGMAEIALQDARGVSADGNVVAGDAEGAAGVVPILGTVATRWTNTGAQPLGALTGDANSFAKGISADGFVVVGTSGSCGCHGFRWAGGAMSALSGLASVYNANADGTVVVGTSELGYPGLSTCSAGNAAGWRLGKGVQYVACDWLPPGTVPPGWSLDSANAVSADGTVVAGDGSNPSDQEQGWVAVLGADCRSF